MNKTAERIWSRRDPQTLRRRQPYNNLLPRTLKWLESLPSEVRPLALPNKFPRIANVLASVWSHPGERQRYFDDLLIDRRGGRTGFPIEVLEDLLKLQEYHQERYPYLPLAGPQLTGPRHQE